MRTFCGLNKINWVWRYGGVLVGEQTSNRPRWRITHERVIITRNGHDAAVISPEDLAQLEETIVVLSDPDALRDIRAAVAAYVQGGVVRGIDAVRQLRR